MFALNPVVNVISNRSKLLKYVVLNIVKVLQCDKSIFLQFLVMVSQLSKILHFYHPTSMLSSDCLFQHLFQLHGSLKIKVLAFFPQNTWMFLAAIAFFDNFLLYVSATIP